MQRGKIKFHVFSGGIKDISSPTFFDIWVKFIEIKAVHGDAFERNLNLDSEKNGQTGNFTFQSVGHILQHIPQQDPNDPDRILYYPVYKTLIHLFRSHNKSNVCISLLTQTPLGLEFGVIDIMNAVEDAYTDVGKEKVNPAVPYVVFLHVEPEWVAPLQQRLNEWVDISE